MKMIMKIGQSIMLASGFFILTAFSDGNALKGKWISKPSEKGNVTSVTFKADNHFDGFVNKKPFVTGTYEFRDSVLSFVDNGCEGKTGSYKVIFFSNSDSVRFEPIQDSCTERMKGMSRLVMGRNDK